MGSIDDFGQFTRLTACAPMANDARTVELTERRGGYMADEPIIAQKGPYQVQLEAGKDYWWCSCGASKKQPFCDGSHKSTTMTPRKFTAETTATYNLCGCKASDDMPFCDGSHNML